MILCALAAARGPLRPVFAVQPAAAAGPEPLPSLTDSIPAGYGAEEDEKTILEYYRDPLTRNEVTDYFAALCESREVASVILGNAEALDVPAALAFSLCREESRYKPWAVNRSNRDGSVDRGLFQLNNRSFPSLAEKDFYNPGVNAWYGMRHLRWCLDSGGSVISALAMYNAGSGRVRSLGAPKNTLDYIHRVLEQQEKIDARFRREFRPLDAGGEQEAPPAEIAGIPKKDGPELPRLIPLLGIR
jgi:soluble lytic murein transglycosylase-like protein